MANPGRATLNIQIREKHKEELKDIKQHYREKSNPNMSMTMVIELMIAEKHRKLKLATESNGV